MTDDRIKMLVEYAISKRISFMRVGDFEFSLREDAGLVEKVEVPLEDYSVEDTAKTLKSKIESQEKKYLQELFQG